MVYKILFEIEISVALICLLASITIFFQSTSELYLKLFPFYFLFGIITESIGEYTAAHNRNNTILLNIYSVLEFAFYFFVLNQVIRNKRIKKIAIWVLCLYLLYSTLNFFLVPSIFNSVAYSISCLFLVGFCIYYFVEIFQLPQTGSLWRQSSFWICTAILFSYCCTFPVFAFIVFFHEPPKIIMSNLAGIIRITNIFTYSLYTIAFLCRIKTSKSMLSS